MSDQGAVCTIEKICPRCAATFECRSGGCWCDNVPLSAVKLKWLEQHYENCLCPACLANVESCTDLSELRQRDGNDHRLQGMLLGDQ